MKEQKLNAYVYAVGIKNRCRKPDRHVLNLGDFPTDMPHDLLKARAKGKVIKDMRICQRAVLKIQPVEVENDNGMEIRSIQLFDKRTVSYDLSETAQEAKTVANG